MDLLHGHFYKTIEEAETAIKEYSKEHYQILLERRNAARLTLFYKIVNKHVTVDTGNRVHLLTDNYR